jgi:hypothetical protein
VEAPDLAALAEAGFAKADERKRDVDDERGARQNTLIRRRAPLPSYRARRRTLRYRGHTYAPMPVHPSARSFAALGTTLAHCPVKWLSRMMSCHVGPDGGWREVL